MAFFAGADRNDRGWSLHFALKYGHSYLLTDGKNPGDSQTSFVADSSSIWYDELDKSEFVWWYDDEKQWFYDNRLIWAVSPAKPYPVKSIKYIGVKKYEKDDNADFDYCRDYEYYLPGFLANWMAYINTRSWHHVYNNCYSDSGWPFCVIRLEEDM